MKNRLSFLFVFALALVFLSSTAFVSNSSQTDPPTWTNNCIGCHLHVEYNANPGLAPGDNHNDDDNGNGTLGMQAFNPTMTVHNPKDAGFIAALEAFVASNSLESAAAKRVDLNKLRHNLAR